MDFFHYCVNIRGLDFQARLKKYRDLQTPIFSTYTVPGIAPRKTLKQIYKSVITSEISEFLFYLLYYLKSLF